MGNYQAFSLSVHPYPSCEWYITCPFWVVSEGMRYIAVTSVIFSEHEFRANSNRDIVKFANKLLFCWVLMERWQPSWMGRLKDYSLFERSTGCIRGLWLRDVCVNDAHREKLCFTQFITRMAAWLLLTFFICLHNQLSSVYSITRIKNTDVWKVWFIK